MDQGPRDLQEFSGLSSYLWLPYPSVRDSHCWVNLTAEVTQPPGPSNYQVLRHESVIHCVALAGLELAI